MVKAWLAARWAWVVAAGLVAAAVTATVIVISSNQEEVAVPEPEPTAQTEVIEKLVLETASYVETVSSDALTTEGGSRILSFAADGSETEMRYMLEDGSTGIMAGHRFADYRDYWIYSFSFAEQVSAVTLDLSLAGQYKVEGSLDGSEWSELAVAADAGEAAIRIGGTGLLAGSLDKLYVRFSDRDPADGFGASLHQFTLTYTPADLETDKGPSGPGGWKRIAPSGGGTGRVPIVTVKLDFDNVFALRSDGNKDELAYMWQESGTGIFEESHRFADAAGYWVYRFVFNDTVMSATADLDISGGYKVEGSSDGVSWTVLEQADGIADRANVSTKLDGVLAGEKTLYLRFSDNTPNDEFGVSLRELRLGYTLQGGVLQSRPVGVVPIEGNNGGTSGEGELKEFDHLRFAAAGGEVEMSYMLEDRSSGVFDGIQRFADGHAYWIYGFRFSSAVAEAKLELELGGQYVVEGSTDGLHWVALRTAKDTPGIEKVDIDLSPVLGNGRIAKSNWVASLTSTDTLGAEMAGIDLYSALSDGPTDLYIRFSDRDPSDGFGAVLRSFQLSYRAADGQSSMKLLPVDEMPLDPGAPVVNSQAFTAGGEDELTYMLNDQGSKLFENGHRFADESAYWTYYFEFSEAVEEAQLEMRIGGQYSVLGSTDGVVWSVLAASEESASPTDIVVDVTNLLQGSQTLHVRFADSRIEDGFGAALWTFGIKYRLAGGGKDAGPEGPTAATDPIEPTIPIYIPPVTGSPGNTFSFTANGGTSELTYLYDNQSSGIFEGERRYADNTAYWVYGFAFADGVKTANLSLELAGQYIVSGSTDGTAWSPLATASGSPGRETVAINLSSLLASEPDKLFLRFEDRNTADGFGAALWSLSMTYTLSGGQTDSGPVGITPPGPTSNTFSFTADGGTVETKYMYSDQSTDIFEGERRYADNAAYWVYGFAFSDGVKTASLSLELAGQYTVSGSTDGTTWSPLATASGSPGRETVAINLSPLLASEPDKLFLRFEDRDTADGFGAALWSLSMSYALSGGQTDSGPVGITPPGPTSNTVSFDSNGGVDEAKYLYASVGSGVIADERRFADETGYWVYGFAFADGVKTASLSLSLENEYIVKGSTDGTTWTTLATAPGRPGRDTVSVDLSPLLASEPDKLFLRFEDHDTSNGFGPALYSLSMTYTLSGGQSDTGPVGITPPGPASNTVSFNANGGVDEAKYLYANVGSGVIADERRFADETGYWVYGFAFADGVKTASLSLSLENEYIVKGSTDGTTWTTLATAPGRPGRDTVSVDLSPLLASEPNELYIRFEDHDTSNGFGPALYSLSMTYTLSGGQTDTGPVAIGAMIDPRRHDGGGGGSGETSSWASAPSPDAAQTEGSSDRAHADLFDWTLVLACLAVMRRMQPVGGRQHCNYMAERRLQP